ncbi:hypothetical protein MM239_17220 [Belliella sp. DSM 111904]|uniref:Uncharacterized protein n=1 Tax=Belliella filtrata TaxID=2923435 RepID=A0ABS9V3Z4_9BACT|nr:hypothetical protein [Belliella filtrata]MCH7411142.1 hypothetical protein [Belliella filtrata]
MNNYIGQGISESTKEQLIKIRDENIAFFSKDAQSMRSGIKSTQLVINNLFKKKEKPSSINELKEFLKIQEFILLIQLVCLDTLCASGSYLDAKFEYQGIYSAKNLIITVNEGAKKLFHYSTYRDKSFWGKNVKEFMKKYSPESLEGYEKINTMLKKLEDGLDGFDWKSKRDLLVHYDNEPQKVYDLLIDLDIDIVSKQSILFIEILKEMRVYTYKLTNDFFENPVN